MFVTLDLRTKPVIIDFSFIIPETTSSNSDAVNVTCVLNVGKPFGDKCEMKGEHSNFTSLSLPERKAFSHFYVS